MKNKNILISIIVLFTMVSAGCLDITVGTLSPIPDFLIGTWKDSGGNIAVVYKTSTYSGKVFYNLDEKTHSFTLRRVENITLFYCSTCPDMSGAVELTHTMQQNKDKVMLIGFDCSIAGGENLSTETLRRKTESKLKRGDYSYLEDYKREFYKISN